MVPVHTVYGTPIRGEDCEIREVGDVIFYVVFYTFLRFLVGRGKGTRKGEMVRKDGEEVNKILDS